MIKQKKASAFLEWFVAQHGPAPKGDENALMRKIIEGEDARERLTAIKQYRRQKESALYAWQAANTLSK